MVPRQSILPNYQVYNLIHTCPHLIGANDVSFLATISQSKSHGPQIKTEYELVRDSTEPNDPQAAAMVPRQKIPPSSHIYHLIHHIHISLERAMFLF